MNGIFKWLGQLQYEKILELLVSALAALVCICVHEVSHGLAALRLGDRTAKSQGRLSLNPLRHMDPVGLILMVVAHFGWAKPVPIDPRNFRHPKRGMMLTALAGPLANLVLAFFALFAAELLLPVYARNYDSTLLYWCVMFFLYVASLSVGLCVFNLLPIPPLDGSKVLFGILPEDAYWRLMRLERYGILVLLLVVYTGVLDKPLYFLNDHLYDFLVTISEPLSSLLTRLYA